MPECARELVSENGAKLNLSRTTAGRQKKQNNPNNSNNPNSPDDNPKNPNNIITPNPNRKDGNGRVFLDYLTEAQVLQGSHRGVT